VLAIVAAILAVGALLVDRRAPGEVGGVNAEGAEADGVDALELARWIRDGKVGLRVVDVRDSVAFDAYHIPTAQRLPASALAGVNAAEGETIVLYTDDSTPAAELARAQRGRGQVGTVYLRGGLAAWANAILEPTLPAEASAEERAAFAEVSTLARWFGGMPRILAPGEAAAARPERATGASPAANAAARVRAIRRGC
jgi:rhodanese-related sulfurtransferase